MKITESLSKGLKNRLFLELSDETQKVIANGRKDISLKFKASRSGWEKYLPNFIKYYEKFLIVFYEGGSKRKPYAAMSNIFVNQNREFNQWREKCLEGMVCISSLEPYFFDYSEGMFNLGEHAISRLYERGDIKFIDDFTVDIYSIIPELKLIPLWSSFWVMVFLCFKGENQHLGEHNEIYPVIPCNSGLFLGKISNGQGEIFEIRTFLDSDSLNFEQQEVRKILLEISDGFESSPLCFLPLIQVTYLDDVTIQVGIIAFEILKNYDLISRTIFHRIEDDSLRIKLKDNFKSTLKELSKGVNPSLIEACRRIGMRNFMVEVKKVKNKDFS